MNKTGKITATLALAAVSAAFALPYGLSGLTFAVGAGGLAGGYVGGEVDFMLSRYVCLGPELAVGFGGGRAVYGGAAGRFYIVPDLHDVFQPHLAFGLGAARAFDDEDTKKVDEGETGAYIDLGCGCDFDVPWSPASTYLGAGAAFFAGDETETDFKAEVGVRIGLGRARRLEEEELARAALERRIEEERLARVAEEERVSQKLAEAEEANRRGKYRQAIKICKEVLAVHPDHAEAGELVKESQRLLAESYPVPKPRPKPKPKPKVKKPTIPPEAVEAYGRGKAALAGGNIGQAIRIFGAVVGEYPTYDAARGKLVDAYLLQGLDLYSKGQLSAALKAWRRALAYDPANAKAKRYVKRVESEIK